MNFSNQTIKLWDIEPLGDGSIDSTRYRDQGSSSVASNKPTVPAVSGMLILSDDFSGYTNTADAIAGSWDYTYSAGSGSIAFEAYPAEPAKNSLVLEYVQAEDIDVLQVTLPANKRHLFFQWREYRSANFDFGPTKDFRITSNGVSGLADFYGLIGTLANTTGLVDDATDFFFNNQGQTQSSPTGDPNVYLQQAITFSRATDYKIEIEFKLNTDTLSDGEFRVWIDDVLLGEITSHKFLPDGYSAYNLDNFQFGMVASNYGEAFAAESKIYRTDFIVSESRIN